jgi:hypothetical protein
MPGEYHLRLQCKVDALMAFFQADYLTGQVAAVGGPLPDRHWLLDGAATGPVLPDHSKVQVIFKL